MLISETLENNTMTPNFGRDTFATLAEMKAVSKKKMPQMIIATCQEDGKVYIYNKSNAEDDTLGLWRPLATEEKVEEETETNKLTYVLLENQAAYDAIETKDPNTLYLIKEE